MSKDRKLFLDGPHARAVYAAGGVTASLILLTLWAIGSLGAGEARALLEVTQPTIRFLCSTTAAAAATILALMLTTLSLSQGNDRALSEIHYRRVKQVALFSIITLVASVFLLMFLVVPLGSSDEVPMAWFEFLYYFFIIASAGLGGLIVMVSVMLYQAIGGLVALIHPDMDSSLVDEDRDEEADMAEEEADEAGTAADEAEEKTSDAA